jgi:hypothetical protein
MHHLGSFRTAINLSESFRAVGRRRRRHRATVSPFDDGGKSRCSIETRRRTALTMAANAGTQGQHRKREPRLAVVPSLPATDIPNFSTIGPRRRGANTCRSASRNDYMSRPGSEPWRPADRPSRCQAGVRAKSALQAAGRRLGSARSAPPHHDNADSPSGAGLQADTPRSGHARPGTFALSRHPPGRRTKWPLRLPRQLKEKLASSQPSRTK